MMNWRIEGVLFPALCVFAIACSLPAQCGHMAPPPPGPSEATPAAGTPASNGNGNAPTPSGPTTPAPSGPGPSGPSAPKGSNPTGPTTGAGAPSAPGFSGPTTGGRGLAISFERGATSKDRLKIDWRHPVPPAPEGTGTAVVSALPLEQALQVLWEGDERPLLVLRECSFCTGTDQALLSHSLNNDRTLLMTKWFRVVRLPPHVTEPRHPFHNVIAGYSFKGSPHLYLLAHPWAEPVEFTGQQTQSSLWQGMTTVIAERYSKDPAKAVREWLSLLQQFDKLDSMSLAMQKDLDEVRAKDGPDSARAKSLEKHLADARKEHAEALAREARVRDLGLLPMPKPATAAAVGAEK
jgi:hypothetical protein